VLELGGGVAVIVAVVAVDEGGGGGGGGGWVGPGSPMAVDAVMSAAPMPTMKALPANAAAAALRTRMLASDPTSSRPVVTGYR
jgi:hypothetical protein